MRLPGAGREHCFIRALIVLPQAAVITTLDEQVKILQLSFRTSAGGYLRGFSTEPRSGSLLTGVA